MFRNVAKTWNRNILKLHIVIPCTLQQRQGMTYLQPEMPISGKCKVWNTFRSREISKQQIRIRWIMQNRDYGTHLKPQYPETSTNENTEDFPYNSLAVPEAIATEQEIREFRLTLPEVIDSLINAYTDVPLLKERYRNLLDYNLGKDKQALGFQVVPAYKAFAGLEELNPENIKLANILGWCVNLCLCGYQITDDIMDASEVRNGNTCWFKKDDVGMQAINDAKLMDDGIYLLLRKHFSGLKCYIPLIEWFHAMVAKSSVGQTDIPRESDGKPPLNIFTWDTYNYIVKGRSSYPAYFLPIISGILLADKYSTELYKQTDAILSEFGFFFAAQNDVLDCYGNPAVTGKVGTDILKGKCSWLVVKALQLATPAQKQILSEHYGRSGQENQTKVRSLYDELGIVDQFLIFEENSFNKVCKLIQQLPNEMHRKFFYNTAEVTYGQKT